jgi:hypothetical protein
LIPSKAFCDSLKPHELELLVAFDQQEADCFIEEWHRRAYKTTLALNLAIREASKNAFSKYIYIAPTKVWARNIVWDDPVMLWKSLPDKAEMGWESNEQRMLINFANGSIIAICGSDDPDTVRGIDFDGAILDEYALHDPTIYTRVLRPIMAGGRKAGASRNRWIMFIYTPKGDNHATQLFNNVACIEKEEQLPTNGRAVKCKPGWFASRVCADKSGIIPEEELKKLLTDVADGRITLEDYEQEMLCRRVRDEERTLITSAMLDRLNAVNWAAIEDHQKYRIVSIDPAFGGDLCSIQGIENSKVLSEKGVHYTLTSEVVLEAKVVAAEIATKNFIVDCIGVGKGVADGLAQDVAGYYVQRFNSSETADGELFANKKAEAVFYVSQQIRQKKVPPIADVDTRHQLVALSKYKVQQGTGKMIMIPNDEVKKVLGCSPDKGLCYVYGLYGLQHVEPLIGGVTVASFSRAGCVPKTVVCGVA